MFINDRILLLRGTGLYLVEEKAQRGLLLQPFFSFLCRFYGMQCSQSSTAALALPAALSAS